MWLPSLSRGFNNKCMLTGLANGFSLYWVSFYRAWQNYHFGWSTFLLPKPVISLFFFFHSFFSLSNVYIPLLLKSINSYCKDFGVYKRTTRKLNLSIISSSRDEHFKNNFLLNLSYAYVCAWPLLPKLGNMKCFLISLHSNKIWLYPSAEGYYRGYYI